MKHPANKGPTGVPDSTEEAQGNAPPAKRPCCVNATSNPTLPILPADIEGILVTKTGLLVKTPTLPLAAYHFLFKSVLSFHKTCHWLLGDTLLLGEQQWGNQYTTGKYKEAMQATGWSGCTIRRIVLTCKRFPLEKRHESLSFTHHQEIAASHATPHQRDQLLAEAAAGKWTCSTLRQKIRQQLSAEKNDPSHFNLLGIPERSAPNAPPLWEAFRYAQWTKTQRPETYDAPQCRQALEYATPIAQYHQRVQERLHALDNEKKAHF